MWFNQDDLHPREREQMHYLEIEITKERALTMENLALFLTLGKPQMAPQKNCKNRVQNPRKQVGIYNGMRRRKTE